MYDKPLAREILSKILGATGKVKMRFEPIGPEGCPPSRKSDPRDSGQNLRMQDERSAGGDPDGGSVSGERRGAEGP